MRRLAILLLLLGAMQAVLPLRADAVGTRTLMTFGFLILAALTVGELAKGVGIPKIVGYLGAGLVFGPYVGGVFDKAAAADLSQVSSLAIALIAFLAGAELEWHELKRRLRTILTMTGFELAASFLAITATLFALRALVPPLQGPPLEALLVAALAASVLIVHSPAVTLGMLSETRASGEVARTTLGIVLVTDVIVLLVFSVLLSVVTSVVGGGAAGASPVLVLWEIVGAIGIGAVLGWLVTLYLRWNPGQLFVFAIAVALFGAEVAKAAHVETLLLLLTAGFVTQNVGGGRGTALRHAMERSAAPVFVVFFALAGAKIDPAAVVRLALVAVPVVLARMGGIWLGARLGAARAGASEGVRRYAWQGLVSQAGVAIGLAALLAESFPRRGPALQGLLLAVVAINETIGPILFRRALQGAGEVGAADPEDGLAPEHTGRDGADAATDTTTAVPA